MKAVLSSLFLLFLFSYQAKAQYGYAYGNSGYNYGRSLQYTPYDDGFLITGAWSWYGNGNTDVFLLKTDSAGKIKWSRTFGGANNDWAYVLRRTSDSNYVMAGYTNSMGNGGYDGYIIKCDSTGKKIWEKTYGGANWDFFYSLEELPDSGFVALGQTYSSGGNGDVYLVRLDKNGDTLWTKTFGGSETDKGNKLALLNNKILVAGYTTLNNKKAGISLTYDLSGQLLNSFIFNYILENELTSVAVSKKNKVFYSGISIDTTSGRNRYFKLVTDTNGFFNEIDTLSTLNGVTVNQIVADTSGGYIAVAANENYGYGSIGAPDIWVEFVNEYGQFVTGPTFGAIKSDEPYELIRISDTSFALVGDTKNFGPAYNHVLLIRFNLFKPIKPETFMTPVEVVKEEYSAKRVYPQPANDLCIIPLGNTKQLALKLFNQTGAEINTEQRYKVNNGHIFLDTSYLSNGIYYLKIKSSKEETNFKIIVTH